MRGVYGRDTLYLLWKLLEKDGVTERIFWAQRSPTEAMRGDLVEFVRYFECTDPPRYAVVPVDKESTQLMGIVWFDYGGHVGCIGVAYRKGFRGKRAAAATALACQYAYQAFGFSILYGFTPYRDAALHGRGYGWRRVATLPRYALIKGKERPLYVMLHEKE